MSSATVAALCSTQDGEKGEEREDRASESKIESIVSVIVSDKKKLTYVLIVPDMSRRAASFMPLPSLLVPVFLWG